MMEGVVRSYSVSYTIEGWGEALDRFAQPVEAVTLRVVTLVDRDGETKQAFEGMLAIEAGGNWIVADTSPFEMAMRMDFTVAGPVSFSCDTGSIRGEIRAYPDYRLPHDAGQLWGKTLVAEHVLETQVPGPDRSITIRWGPFVEDESTLVDGVPLDVVRVARFVDDREETWWMAKGVPHPVQTVSRMGGIETTTRLTKWYPGDVPLAWDRPVVARFNGTHPDAHLTQDPFETLAALALEHPLHDAMEWLRTDPRALEGRLWLDAPPGAKLSDAHYHRDPANHSYEWELTFTTASESLYAWSSRRDVNGVPTRAAGAQVYAGAGSVIDGPVVDASTALMVLEAHHPAGTDWRVLSWRVLPDSGGVRAYYFISEEGGKHDPPDLPVHLAASHWIGNPHAVDARDGGIAGASFFDLGCGFGLGAGP